MSTLTRLLDVRIKYGDSPEAWDKKLRRYVPFCCALSTLSYFAGLTQQPDPFLYFDFTQAGWQAWLSWSITGGIFLLSGIVSLLILSGRAAGVVFFIALFGYIGPMLTALGLSVIALNSWTILIGTVFTSCLSIAGVARLQLRISASQISDVASERIFLRAGDSFLLNPQAIDQPMQLTPLGSFKVAFFEVFLVMAVFVVGLFSMPVSFFDILVGNGIVAPVVWFLSVLMFLAARRPVGDQIVLARAMAYRSNAEC